MKKTLYDIFGISPDASAETIRTAYKSLVQRHHPDKNRDDPHSEEILKAINYAYSILSNAKKRAAYDHSLGLPHDHLDADQTRRAPVTPTPPAAPPEPPQPASTEPVRSARPPLAPEESVPRRNDNIPHAAKPSEPTPPPATTPPHTSEAPSGPTRIRIAMAVLGMALVGGFLAFLLPDQDKNVEIAPLASSSLPDAAITQNNKQDTPAATATPSQKETAPAGERGATASKATSPVHDQPEKIAPATDTRKIPPTTVSPEKSASPTPPVATAKAPDKATEQVKPVQPAKTLAMNGTTGNTTQPAKEKTVTPQAKAANSGDKPSDKPAPQPNIAPKASVIEQKPTPSTATSSTLATLPSAKTTPPPATPSPKTADAPPPPPHSQQAAVEPVSKPAASGDAATNYKEGLRHEKGEGATQNYGEAARLYQKAAAQGVADAQYRLGRLYTLGKGVPLDNVEAYAWLSLAAASHVEAAKPIVEYLGNIMTPQQIEEAKRKAKALQGAKKR